MRIKWEKDAIGNYHGGIFEFNFGLPSQKSHAIILPPRGDGTRFLAKIKYNGDIETMFISFSTLASAKRWASKQIKRNAGVIAK